MPRQFLGATDLVTLMLGHASPPFRCIASRIGTPVAPPRSIRPSPAVSRSSAVAWAVGAPAARSWNSPTTGPITPSVPSATSSRANARASGEAGSSGVAGRGGGVVSGMLGHAGATTRTLLPHLR